MKHRKYLSVVFLCLSFLANSACRTNDASDENFTALIVSANNANVHFYWQDDEGKLLKNIENLKKQVEKNGQRLRFAMNGGMYQEDNKPLGLFIQDGKALTPLNTRSGEGNFYLKPNGVFYIRKDKQSFIVPTQDFKDDGQINYATQSGPMLLIDGNINAEFKQHSDNLNIRNGVCVLADNRIVFAISRREVNFYDFAEYFKNLGCRNALYLDGFVSRMYAPEANIEQTDGNFGVIIGIAE
jgi:uncharacterized protein YigE (DUF2233 family)